MQNSCLQSNSAQVGRQYKYPYFLLGLYLFAVITTMATANKLVAIGSFILPGGIFVFPLSFIINDIAAETYGYSYPRLFIWIGLLTTLLFSLYSIGVSWTNSPDFFDRAVDYQKVFAPTFRFFVSTVVSLFVAEFINIFLLAKSKILYRGRFFILRSLVSTAIAQLALSVTSDLVAFSGETDGIMNLINMMLSGFSIKLLVAVVAVFPSWLVVQYLKKKDHVDHYDVNTKFTPFSLSFPVGKKVYV